VAQPSIPHGGLARLGREEHLQRRSLRYPIGN